MSVNIDDLFKPKVGEREVELPDYGTFRVRGLTRAEALEIQGVEMGMAQMERKLLSMALLDPKLTEDEVGRWQENCPANALDPLSEAIVELSGMTKESAKQAMRQFRK